MTTHYRDAEPESTPERQEPDGNGGTLVPFPVRNTMPSVPGTPADRSGNTAGNGSGNTGPRSPEPDEHEAGGDTGSGDLVPVVEGELLTEEESRELDRRLGRKVVVKVATSTAQVATKAATGSVALVRKVGQSEHTHTAGKALVRNSLAVALGLKSWVVRAYDASTMGVYRRQIRAAEVVGNQELVAEWTERQEKVKAARHQRLMDLPNLMRGIAVVTGGTIVVLVFLVLLVGVLAQVSGMAQFTDIIAGVMSAIRWTFTAVAFAWTPFVMSLPFLVFLAAWREGRRHGQLPGWMQTSADSDIDVTIDETTIARALDALRIPQITAYLKSGFPLQFITPARVDGRGTHAVVRLPAGVPAEKIAKRRSDLAAGLHRLSKEVWPTTGSEAGILDLWVADKGALAEGAGPYPLLEDGLTDVFKGVPFGKTLRGEPIVAPVIERNTMAGGQPGQGKSTADRAIMAGAALDPTAELRIWVPDANYDFEAFKPRCSRYVMGAEDEKIAEILDDLRDLHAEVQQRGNLLVKYQIPAVTREYASKDVGLHPLFCLLEEAHVAIQHPAYGKEISKLLIDIVRLGRKRAIHLILSTQAPTKDSMPRDITRNCTNGIAFAVGDWVANDALLGQGAFRAGHRATELIPGTDRGTAVVKGFTGERSDIVQVYFIDVARENDQITPIIQRAMDAIAERGQTPGGIRRREQEPQTRDLLEDLAAVLGNDSVPAANVPALLARHAPSWIPYQRLTGKALREQLADKYGIKVPTTGNKYPVDPATIRHELAQLEAAREAELDDDETDDDWPS